LRPFTNRSSPIWQAQKIAFTIEEAAELLSLSRAQVYRLIEVGELGSLKIGKARRVSAGQLVEFIRRVEADPPLTALQLLATR
jgi:excisionase family DNA binding protein